MGTSPARGRRRRHRTTSPFRLGNLAGMDENRARRITDALRDRGINAHLRKSGIDAYAVQVPAGGGREAVWGAEGTAGLEAEVLLDGDLVGFVPEIPGSDPNPRVKRPAVIHSRVDDLEDSCRAGGHDKSPVLAPGPRVQGLSAGPGPGPGLGRGAGDGAGGRG